MKKVMIALAVILVLIVGGLVLVYNNLDSIVETAIETAGTSATGSRVEVGSVELDLIGGSASIYDFSIANPPGYSSGDMARFGELSVSINLQDTNSQNVHINSVVARSPYVLYETIDGVSNFETVSGRFETDTEEESASQVMMEIDSIVIEDIQGTLQSGTLPGPVEVNLGDIRLSDLQGTPEDLAAQIMGPVISQIGAAAAQALVKATTELLSNSADQVSEQLGDTIEDVGDTADKALEKVGNLLKRN